MSAAHGVDLRSLRRLERSFYRAPSAHNTQPWVLTYEQDRVELRFDPRRHLAVGDPTRRDLLLGLGAFVETVLVTAASEGARLRFEPSLEGERIGSFFASDEEYVTSFSRADVERRSTSRLAYAAGRVPPSALAAAREHLAPAERLHHLGTRDLLPLVVAADHALYGSRATVGELRQWLRLSKRHPDYSRDGLTYECLDLSLLEARLLAVLLRPRVYALVRATRLHRLFGVTSKSLLDVDGTVLVLERERDGPEEILASGRSLLRVWLELARAGFYVHPFSQVIDHHPTERALAARLALGDGHRILSVFRLGRSAQPPRSHRLV